MKRLKRVLKQPTEEGVSFVAMWTFAGTPWCNTFRIKNGNIEIYDNNTDEFERAYSDRIDESYITYDQMMYFIIQEVD